MPCDDFQDPFITCSFVTDECLFVNLFYNKECDHYHFIWDTVSRQIHGPVKVKLGKICSRKNFPIGCFYNFDKNEIYSFYRQGQAFTIDPESLNYRIEQIMFRDIGQVILCNNKILVVRSSQRIQFYRQIREDNMSELHWAQYHELTNIPGFLYTNKNNNRF